MSATFAAREMSLSAVVVYANERGAQKLVGGFMAQIPISWGFSVAAAGPTRTFSTADATPHCLCNVLYTQLLKQRMFAPSFSPSIVCRA